MSLPVKNCRCFEDESIHLQVQRIKSANYICNHRYLNNCVREILLPGGAIVELYFDELRPESNIISVASSGDAKVRSRY